MESPRSGCILPNHISWNEKGEKRDLTALLLLKVTGSTYVMIGRVCAGVSSSLS